MGRTGMISFDLFADISTTHITPDDMELLKVQVFGHTLHKDLSDEEKAKLFNLLQTLQFEDDEDGIWIKVPLQHKMNDLEFRESILAFGYSLAFLELLIQVISSPTEPTHAFPIWIHLHNDGSKYDLPEFDWNTWEKKEGA